MPKKPKAPIIKDNLPTTSDEELDKALEEFEEEQAETVIAEVVETKLGRPTDYTVELAEKICERIAQGNSMRKVCRDDDMPAISSVFSWFRVHPEFAEQYARACSERSEAHHEGLMDLGDEALELAQYVDPKASNAVVQAVKLKADNLKWSMSKMQPKKYGEKLDVTSGGKPIPILGGTSVHEIQPDNLIEENTGTEEAS